MAPELDGNGTVAGFHVEIDSVGRICDVKIGVVVFAGKEASAGCVIEEGIGVTARDENAFLGLAVFVLPLDGNAVGGVFAAEADEAGKANRADLFEANKANAGDGGAVVKFWAEFGRELALYGFGVDSEIDQ
jgi:hypothetical protein